MSIVKKYYGFIFLDASLRWHDVRGSSRQDFKISGLPRSLRSLAKTGR